MARRPPNGGDGDEPRLRPLQPQPLPLDASWPPPSYCCCFRSVVDRWPMVEEFYKRPCRPATRFSAWPLMSVMKVVVDVVGAYPFEMRLLHNWPPSDDDDDGKGCSSSWRRKQRLKRPLRGVADGPNGADEPDDSTNCFRPNAEILNRANHRHSRSCHRRLHLFFKENNKFD